MSSVINETLLLIKSAFEAGINLVNGGNAVSSSNPLPVSASQLPASLGIKKLQEALCIVNSAGTSIVTELLLGRSHNIKLTQAAVSAQYARVQIYNPVGSGVELLISAINSYAGSAGTHVYSVYAVDISTELGTAATSRSDTNYRLGGDVVPSIQLLGRNSATAITTTGIVDTASHTSVTAPGSAIILPSGLISIPEGKCLEFAIGTLNVSVNIVVSLMAVPT